MRFVLAMVFVALVLFNPQHLSAREVCLSVRSGEWKQLLVNGIDPDSETFLIEAEIDPVQAGNGDLQVVSGIVIGLENNATPVSDPNLSLRFHIREGAGRARFDVWNRQIPLSRQIPNPRPAGWTNPSDEYQSPTTLPVHDGQAYRIRIVVWPDGKGSVVRLFIDFDDRPVQDYRTDERIRAGIVKLFTMRGGQQSQLIRTSCLKLLRAESVEKDQATQLPTVADSVLAAVDLSHPTMKEVRNAVQQGNSVRATDLLLHHMKSRSQPRGPSLKEAEATAHHPAWQQIADEVLNDRYGTVGYFSEFASHWKDTSGQTHSWVLKKQPLQINWPRCSGYLNRHFHWVSLARAWNSNPKPEYAKRFSDEVYDWVTREPFFWKQSPLVGGVNLMDGTVFSWGYMNTSNIGRRLELTWWPAYEVFRRSPDFRDEAHLAMLLGMLRQARLIMNPSSFAAHDDGGAHTTMALLQTALLLPEFKESAAWKATALARWETMLKAQFHPDGTHVSLSTGYNWASIKSVDNYLSLMQRLGQDPPARYLRILEKALEHPMLLSTPTQSQIDLNDGGWGMIDDHFQQAAGWFPERDDFLWMSTQGANGTPPKERSLYYPNAGQYIMRTGWGPDQKYVFFGAGPWGASHGKFDALNLYAQRGRHLLIRNAGRGSYSGIGNTIHAGQSLSFNTLSPDWAQENSIPHWKQDMHKGFHPPERRWFSNKHFDYAEGCFEYGWHRRKKDGSGEHIQGKWIRQVVFVKGNDAVVDGYFIVVDTVQPKDSVRRTWRHPWQLGLNAPNIAINRNNKTISAFADSVALQILPVDPEGDLELTVISGQEEPERLGWRIYGKTATPWPVPTYEWQTNSTFSRAWVIQMQASKEEWPVDSISVQDSEHPGELQFLVRHKSGRTDSVMRRFPKAESSDFVVVSKDRNSEVIATLNMKGGHQTVAAQAKK